MVYVLAHNGSPLMPTENHGYVRKLLSSRKAVVVQTKPFTIRLKSNPGAVFLYAISVKDQVIGVSPRECEEVAD